MVEKIKVNLSYSVYNLLLHDMEDFKFDIKDDIPNKNLFYNTIVKNMVSRRKKSVLGELFIGPVENTF